MSQTKGNQDAAPGMEFAVFSLERLEDGRVAWFPAGRGRPRGEQTVKENIWAGKRATSSRRWRWLPGMLPLLPDGDEGWAAGQRLREGDGPPPPEAIPDLEDPATVGCLLALVRQVYGDWGVCIGVSSVCPYRGRSLWPATVRHWWTVCGVKVRDHAESVALTEGAALAGALMAWDAGPEG